TITPTAPATTTAPPSGGGGSGTSGSGGAPGRAATPSANAGAAAPAGCTQALAQRSVATLRRTVYVKRGHTATVPFAVEPAVSETQWNSCAAPSRLAWRVRHGGDHITVNGKSLATAATGAVLVATGRTVKIKVKAVKKTTYYVTATTGGTAVTVKIKVVTKAATLKKLTITSKPAEYNVVPGGTDRLGAKLKPGKATGVTVTWKSSDTSVATVDAAGVLHGIQPGTAIISARAKGKTARFELTVS
ncbi:MAG: Ig-like domain-containing protein, partial [Bifidobacteriaceae bacterium]|nr:Ig-like domain-containing protein [Bifidobacteriaceae bacterium]